MTRSSSPSGSRIRAPRGGLDQAPVTVNIVSARAHGVLAVPVSALVALAGGGYAVQVVTGGAAHLAGVHTGLFSSSLVQVSGAGLRAGLRVEVPCAMTGQRETAPPQAGQPVLELAGVTKTYPGPRR